MRIRPGANHRPLICPNLWRGGGGSHPRTAVTTGKMAGKIWLLAGNPQQLVDNCRRGGLGENILVQGIHETVSQGLFK